MIGINGTSLPGNNSPYFHIFGMPVKHPLLSSSLSTMRQVSSPAALAKVIPTEEFKMKMIGMKEIDGNGLALPPLCN